MELIRKQSIETTFAGNSEMAAAAAAKLASLAPSPDPKPVEKRELIILADDNADMRQYLARLLEDRYEVHAVADGRQALDATRQLRPALVLADVMMPHLDGFGLLRAIREDSALASTPVILLSARAGEESRVEGLQAHADDYLVKPFAARELLARVATHVKMANFRREAAEREERLRSAMEHVALLQQLPVSAWTLNPDGTPDFVNQVWLEFAGQTLDFVRSHPEAWMTAVHPEDREVAAKSLWEGVQKGQSFAFQTRSLRAQDGTYRWHLQQAVPLRDAEGKVLKFVGTTTDIDDQKRAEEGLLKSEQNLRLIITTMPVMAWSTLADGSVDFINQRWLDYTGMPTEQGKGWGWAQAIHPDDLGRLKDYWLSVLASGQPGEIEARLRRFDGSYRWFLFRASPLRDESGAIVKWYGTNTDIHDRKRAEEELRNTQAELERVMRAMTMGQLTASIAHEVNQPLSGIITNAGTCLRMLDASPPNLEGARETARRTIRDGRRASDVITRLRTLYGKKEVVPEPMDLNEVTQEVISLSLGELERNRVVLRQDLAEGLPLVMADRIQIQQVILNLIRNGSDAMSAIDDRPRELNVKTVLDESGGARLSVKDSGVGIDPEIESKLFEPFYTTKSDGMGIGLSVSRSIMESHRGRLWAVRNQGPGASFSLSIPCSTSIVQ